MASYDPQNREAVTSNLLDHSEGHTNLPKMPDEDDLRRDLETREEKIIGNIVFTLQDGDGEWDGSNVTIDSESVYSYIHPDTVTSFKLKILPIRPEDIQSIISPLDPKTEIEVNVYVELNMRCKQLGLGSFKGRLGVVAGDWKVLIGKRLMNTHDIWTKIGHLLKNDGKKETLLALRIVPSKSKQRLSPITLMLY